MMSMSRRCPSAARNSAVASIERNWPTAELDAPLKGSTIDAKPRPIALLIASPAISAAASPIWSTKPIERPITTSPITNSKPGTETMPSGGSAIPDAATAGTPTASAITSRSCTGTLVAPNTGAAMKAAPGRIIPSIHSWSIASIFGMSAGFIVALTNERRDLCKDFAGEVGQQHQDAAAEDGEADRRDDQLGHKGQCLFVDRGARLYHAEQHADNEHGQQQRCRGERQNPQRLLRHPDEIIGLHVAILQRKMRASPSSAPSRRPARKAAT